MLESCQTKMSRTGIISLGMIILRMLLRSRKRHRGELLPDINILAVALQGGQERIQYARLNCRVPVLRSYMDVERDMKPVFRLTRQAFHGLVEMLDQEKDHGWGHHLELLIFLFWLAHATSYRVTAQAFEVPKTTVCRVVHRTAKAIRRNKSKAIFFPSADTLHEVGQGFGNLAQHEAFNKAVGAMDGYHIRIKPPKHNELDYLNYNQFHSIQCQAICDSNGSFLDIFVGYGGSVHDTCIFKNSPVYVDALYPPPGYFLLADDGYPCLELPVTVITPYGHPLQGRIQEKFNSRHSRAHSIIERSFGMMKARWHATFIKALEVRLHFCSEVVLACAFLHNICLRHGDVMDELEELPEEPAPPAELDEGVQEQSGVHIRDRLCALVSAPSTYRPHY
ncbi:putative nuclease HARBI1 [Cololabis saira]|uniref:putative nuclease HARBI1 n=1 Tax=Cololabis saira TaxID=129043 RepID=UPI002AD2FDC0|nr:putative nuclease HARBI1 [Cololabis saira]